MKTLCTSTTNFSLKLWLYFGTCRKQLRSR